MSLKVEKIKLILENYIQSFERNITVLMSLYIIIPVISTLLLTLLHNLHILIQVVVFIVLITLSILIPIYVKSNVRKIEDLSNRVKTLDDNLYLNLKKAIELNTSFTSTLCSYADKQIQYKLFNLLNNDNGNDLISQIIRLEFSNCLSQEERNLIPEKYLTTSLALDKLNLVLLKWFRIIEIVIPIQLITILAIKYLVNTLKLNTPYLIYIIVPICSIILYLVTTCIVLREERLRKRILILGGIVIILSILILNCI